MKLHETAIKAIIAFKQATGQTWESVAKQMGVTSMTLQNAMSGKPISLKLAKAVIDFFPKMTWRDVLGAER